LVQASIQAIYYLIVGKKEFGALGISKSQKEKLDGINPYKILAKFTHDLHYGTLYEEAVYDLRTEGTSFQLQFFKHIASLIFSKE
jgi:hypothetical protein